MPPHRTPSNPPYYGDPSGWDVPQWQNLWAYTNRMFLNAGAQRHGEIAALDLSRVDPTVAWVLKHLLIHQSRQRYDRYLVQHPNLWALCTITRPPTTVTLNHNPIYCYPYLTDKGILL